MADETKRPTLTDEQISTTPSVSRRTGLGLVGGAAVALVATEAKAQGVTDADDNPGDPVGRGRGRGGPGGPRSGATDADPGDPPGRGRGAGPSGATDTDKGPRADAAGRGRAARPSGQTDSDQGENEDPPGNGRQGRQQAPPGRAGATDADQGPTGDPPGQGRGRGGRRSTGI